MSKEIKIGDKLFLQWGGIWGSRYKISRVIRLTKTRVVCDRHSFMKSTKREVGGNGWFEIYAPDKHDKIIQEHMDKIEVKRLKGYIGDNLKNLDLPTLRKIKELMPNDPTPKG